MKKKLMIGVLSAGLILGGALAVGATNKDKQDSTAQKVSDMKEMITIEEAKQIALGKADGVVEGIELDQHKGNHYYEVEIENERKDFDIYIDAYTGEVLSVEEDDDNDDDRDQVVSDQSLITHQKAIEIAEKAVNGKVTEINLDEDDNQYHYELELKTNKGEAEVELDAVTGKVLELEIDDLED